MNDSNDTTPRPVIEGEMTVFLVFLSVISILAIPPNILLLYLTVKRIPHALGHTGCCGRRGGSVISSRGSRRSGSTVLGPQGFGASRPPYIPVLLISQTVVHVLICLTCPLDILFLMKDEKGGRRQRELPGILWELECLVFLAVKSGLMLFSVMVVSLQGVDKIYKVHNISRPYLKVKTKVKLVAICVITVISVTPVILQVILTDAQLLKSGCYVLPAVVDVTEAIFFGSCAISVTSLVIVIIMLRRHSRKVSAGSESDADRKDLKECQKARGGILTTKIFSVSEHLNDLSKATLSPHTEGTTDASPKTSHHHPSIEGERDESCCTRTCLNVSCLQWLHSAVFHEVYEGDTVVVVHNSTDSFSAAGAVYTACKPSLVMALSCPDHDLLAPPPRRKSHRVHYDSFSSVTTASLQSSASNIETIHSEQKGNPALAAAADKRITTQIVSKREAPRGSSRTNIARPQEPDRTQVKFSLTGESVNTNPVNHTEGSKAGNTKLSFVVAGTDEVNTTYKSSEMSLVNYVSSESTASDDEFKNNEDIKSPESDSDEVNVLHRTSTTTTDLSVLEKTRPSQQKDKNEQLSTASDSTNVVDATEASTEVDRVTSEELTLSIDLKNSSHHIPEVSNKSENNTTNTDVFCMERNDSTLRGNENSQCQPIFLHVLTEASTLINNDSENQKSSLEREAKGSKQMTGSLKTPTSFSSTLITPPPLLITPSSPTPAPSPSPNPTSSFRFHSVRSSTSLFADVENTEASMDKEGRLLNFHQGGTGNDKIALTLANQSLHTSESVLDSNNSGGEDHCSEVQARCLNGGVCVLWTNTNTCGHVSFQAVGHNCTAGEKGHHHSSASPSVEKEPKPHDTNNHSSTSRGRLRGRGSRSRSTATLRRLKMATVTAAKRGVLMLAIFLLCYLPLMAILLILSIDHPVYEIALLLEGLTLPITYVHALVTPLLVMRLDPEWRHQATSVFRVFCKCQGKLHTVETGSRHDHPSKHDYQS